MRDLNSVCVGLFRFRVRVRDCAALLWILGKLKWPDFQEQLNIPEYIPHALHLWVEHQFLISITLSEIPLYTSS